MVEIFIGYLNNACDEKSLEFFDENLLSKPSYFCLKFFRKNRTKKGKILPFFSKNSKKFAIKYKILSIKSKQIQILYPKDRRRLKRTPNLALQEGFWLSRTLKSKFKLKDKICISHKPNFALIARYKRKIGVDVEELIQRDFNAVMEFCFDEKERAMVTNADDAMLEFYKIFTAKEAYVKLKNLDFGSLSVKFYEIFDKMDLSFIKFGEFLITIVKEKL